MRLAIVLLLITSSWLTTTCRVLAEGVEIVEKPAGLICTGWNPVTKQWGLTGILGAETPGANCPLNQAYFSVRRQAQQKRSGSKIPIAGTCCPVPPDALTDQHLYVSETCPVNFVATGARQLIPDSVDTLEQLNWQNTREQQMRCTKINTQKYQLGPAQSAYSIGWHRHISELFDKRTTRARLPIAIRYGIGRLDSTKWKITTCVGFPWGSILVEKTSKRCSGFNFSQLQFNGLNGEQVKGDPVVVYDDCTTLSDPLSANPECLKLK